MVVFRKDHTGVHSFVRKVLFLFFKNECLIFRQTSLNPSTRKNWPTPLPPEISIGRPRRCWPETEDTGKRGNRTLTEDIRMTLCCCSLEVCPDEVNVEDFREAKSENRSEMWIIGKTTMLNIWFGVGNTYCKLLNEKNLKKKVFLVTVNLSRLVKLTSFTRWNEKHERPILILPEGMRTPKIVWFRTRHRLTWSDR